MRGKKDKDSLQETASNKNNDFEELKDFIKMKKKQNEVLKKIIDQINVNTNHKTSK